MRDIGYSLETALADIIDNSITAQARNIQLFANIDDSDVRIGILDDGEGMTENDLLEAMRPGCRSPLDTRGISDLGRFGLGLKTASFSQCRRLTVVTRRDGDTSAAIWDLDYVAEQDDWLVQIPDDSGELPWVHLLGGNGTLVIWEKMDRLLSEADSVEARPDILRRIDEARKHLELVFHRFLSGEHGIKRFECRTTIALWNHTIHFMQTTPLLFIIKRKRSKWAIRRLSFRRSHSRIIVRFRKQSGRDMKVAMATSKARASMCIARSV